MTCAVIAIDPGMRRMGVSVWTYETDPATNFAMVNTALCVFVASDTRRARDRYETIRHEAVSALGDARWWAVIERPPPPKLGTRAAPVAAVHDSEEWLHDLARQRATDAGERYVKPTIAKPLPQDWRAPLGLPTAGPRHLETKARRAHLKDQAKRYAQTQLGLGELDDDAAEAACLGAWATRCALLGVYPVGQGRKRRFESIKYVA